MAFTKMKLTTFGTTLETKWKQGKGVHFTRIALGDGLLGNGSMINRTSLISERHSIQIDGITAADDAKQAVVIGTLDNRDLEEGFSYRELALMAKDPDTGQEGTYLYDNAGQECEFLDTQENGTLIYERIKILIRSEQTDTITFEASGNPVYLTAGDLAELIKNKADLGEDGKVVPEQLPDMDIQALLADAQLKKSLADNDAVVVTDSAAENTIKRVLWSKIKGLFALASHSHAAGDITSGTLASARIPDLAASKITSGTLPVSIGGTGQTTITPGVATCALRAIYGGTSSMTAGSTALATGCVYLQYE